MPLKRIFNWSMPSISPVNWALKVLISRMYVLKGYSMEPSFEPGSAMLVNRKAYWKCQPMRGDIVIVHDPKNLNREYLKRVVGLPGEEISLSDGILFINGKQTPEPYLCGLPSSPGLVNHNWKMADDEYFVLGDNRAHSTDSRKFGPISLELIEGKVWFQCWPLSHWSPTKN